MNFMSGDESSKSDKNKNFEHIPKELKQSVEDPAKNAVKTLRKRCVSKSLELKDKAQDTARDVKTLLEERLATIQSIWDGKLFKFVDLPEWMKDNEYITDMHRPQITSLKSCLRSVFSIHSETGNIWTHLIGALVFLGLIIWYLVRDNGDFIKPLEEKAVVVTFYSSAFLCLSFSTLFHTLGCNSAETCLFCGRLDYTGIAVLITGSFLPWVYYSFYCEAQIKQNYMIVIGVLGALCTAVSLLKSFALPKYRALRGILFLVFGMCGIAPCIHASYYHGLEYSFSKGQMQNLVMMGALYMIGVAHFITRFPESVWPGKFNLVFQSHQIFHVLVVSAALVQVWACSVLQHNRFLDGDSCFDNANNQTSADVQ